MYRTAVRHTPRAIRAVRQTSFPASSRRLLTTASGPRKGTWKGTFARWGVAIGAVYWYNTSPIFADEADPLTVPPPPQFAESDLPTVNAVVEEKRKQAEKVAQKTAAPPPPTEEAQTAAAPETGHAQSPEELEEEAGPQGAFDPETGEINWDCPCLGGMADGPCGEEFKAAFSCFVYSTEEPKGMDCIDKFQHMQDCFRKYPEVYGAELAEDEGEDAPAPVDGATSGDGEETASKDQERTPEVAEKETQHPVKADPDTSSKTAKPSPDAKKEEDAITLNPTVSAVAEQTEKK